MSTYEVEAYSRSKLNALLDKHSHESAGSSDSKAHLTYLDGYLVEVGAKTILVECPYTDKDYLEDYAAYYARCHAEYGRRCARLHFFGTAFDDAAIGAAIAGDGPSVQMLKDTYLGFIVVKPLPSTVIGRTCLITYRTQDHGRSYPTIRPYNVHVFGIELTVRSLPFQEQDKDVAACATSALWSVFNATGHLFQHHIPSPAEITEAAAAAQRLVSRTLPAGDGLSSEQMADAIRSVGLEPLHLRVQNVELLVIMASAYLRAGIPCLLTGAIVEDDPAGQSRTVGRHALALAGYGTEQAPLRPYDADGTLFKATSINRFYSHDDQTGPFARATIDRARARLSIPRSEKDGTIGNSYLQPEIILLPLYHKIRVPIDSVIATVTSLNKGIALARQNFPTVDLPDQVVWDVALSMNADLKSSIYGDHAILPRFRESVLRDDLPRYVWRVSASSGDGAKLFDLLFDATDLLQGGHVAGGLPYDRDVCLAIAAFTKNPLFLAGNRGSEMASKWFRQNARIF
jgi:hypothetical protein